jgi:hypothetical protein
MINVDDLCEQYCSDTVRGNASAEYLGFLTPAAPLSLDEARPRGGWLQIRARLAAEKIAERRKRAVSPHDYMDGYVPGGHSEDISTPS